MFFVDPYLDAEFVSRYLPYVAEGVSIRLLGARRNEPHCCRPSTLSRNSPADPLPCVCRTGLHDRYLFIDEAACYLSGASFKDGAKNAPAVLMQITDAFEAMWDTYQRRWNDRAMDR